MHSKHFLRPRSLSALGLTLALGCAGAPSEEAPEPQASRTHQLSTASRPLPPGLAPSLVKDLQPGPDTHQPAYLRSSEPTDFVTLKGVAYFVAREESTGQELWRSDGTPEGTWLVRDLTPGSIDQSNLYGLTVAGESLYMLVSTQRGQHLWKSDGTAEGTVPVRTSEGSTVGASALSACGGLLFFSRFGEQGDELWRTDGTPEGTRMLPLHLWLEVDPVTGAMPTACANGSLFVMGRGESWTQELWKSDGTSEGTVDLGQFDVPPWFPDTPVLTAVGSRVFFVAHTPEQSDALWTSDGTAEGTTALRGATFEAGPLYPRNLTAIGETLFFAAYDFEHGEELWRSDGTPAGTRLVADLIPGPESSWLNRPMGLGETLLVSTHERLYRSDGTAEGTVPVKDLSVDALSDSALLGGRLLFPSMDGHLWLSDGTEAGTFPLELPEGVTPMQHHGLLSLGDRVLFSAFSDATGTELWVTDGTPEGTRLVRDIFRADSSAPESLTDMQGTLFFSAYDSAHGRQLWTSDGSPEGTRLLADLGTPTSPWSPANAFRLTALGDTLSFFLLQDWKLSLWKSDGTTTGTLRVRDLGYSYSLPSSSLALGSTLLFTWGEPTTGAELWKSDGTPEGTVLLKELRAGRSGSTPRKLTRAGDAVFFIANDGLHGDELWKTDGTPEGTVLVKDVRPGLGSSLELYGVSELGAAGGTLFFTANDGLHGSELWKTDGTPEGTVLVRDLRPGASGSGIYDLVEVEGTLYFTAEDGLHGRELWKSDGTPEGTVLVADLVPGAGSPFPYTNPYAARPSPLHAVGGTLYFAADDGVHGLEPWKTDGTAGGTVLLRDVMPGPLGSGVGVGAFVPVGPHGTFAFAAATASTGLELWMSDGTPEGTRPLPEPAPGPLSSSPLHLTVSGSRLYLVADEGTHGRELWSVKQAAFTVRP